MFSHDAIAIGNDEVVEYGGDTVRQCTLQNFEKRALAKAELNWKAAGLLKHGPHSEAVGTIHVREYDAEDGEPTARGPTETVNRVRSRLGEQKYNRLTNNSQNLCYWSKALRKEQTDATKGFALLRYLRTTLQVWSRMPSGLSGGAWLKVLAAATPLLVVAELADIGATYSQLEPRKQTTVKLATLVITKVLKHVAEQIGTKLVVKWAASTLASATVPGSCQVLLANFIAAPSVAGAGALVAGVGQVVGGFVAAHALPLALGAAAVLCLGGAAAWAWKKHKKRKKRRRL